jgi:hypothetical protein
MDVNCSGMCSMVLLVGENKPQSEVLCCSSMTSVRRELASPCLELDGVNMVDATIM